MAGILVFTVLLSLPMPGEDETQRFDDIFTRGVLLYSKGDYGAALTLFREADRLKVTPEVVYDMARAYEKLGDQAFTILYDRLYLTRARDASDAPDISIRVERSLMKLDDEGRGFVEVFAPGARNISVAGRFFPTPPAALFLPPGEYPIEADFAGTRKTTKVQVKEGRPTSFTFEPAPPPLTKADGWTPQLQSTRSIRPGEVSKQFRGLSLGRLATYVSLGIAAGAFALGLMLGVLSNADATRVGDLNLTVREARMAAADGNLKATGANILFVAGAVALATGGAFFVFSFPEARAAK